MGHGTRSSGGHTIRTFEPDDTDKAFYLSGQTEFSLQEFLEKAQAKWPGITAEELIITAEHIQTDCIGYDLYDPNDYLNYICFTASDTYFERMEKADQDSLGGAE